MNSCASERYAVPAALVIPVVYKILFNLNKGSNLFNIL